VTDARSEFLAGERPDDVALFLADRVLDDPEPLLEYGERTEEGVLLVMEGETGRSVFQSATDMDAMAFAGKAMRTEGAVDADLAGGTCPKAAEGEDHAVRFVFAFVEEENEEVGGRYGEGDVVHAYAHCECGAAYSENWVVGERT